MIVIQRGHNMGSKKFAIAVANNLMPYLKDILNEDEREEFSLDFLHATVHFGYWDQSQFMRVFQIIESLNMGEFENERLLLLNLMKQDPRYQKG